MSFYEIDYAYKIKEWGVVTLEADDVEQAEDFGKEYVRESFPDVTEIEIEGIKEIKR